MALKRLARLVLLACGVVAVLAYLRDPPWLLSYTYGLYAWEADPERGRVRWTQGHAAFFVPADARAVTLPLRSPRESPSDWPITAIITLDDQVVERLTFSDEDWHLVTVRLPPRGSRQVRRIDIKLDHTRTRNRGIQLREVELHQ